MTLTVCPLEFAVLKNFMYLVLKLCYDLVFVQSEIRCR
jgi:hypothetical protein